MNKVDIINKLESLNFDKNEYCIISGGILVMYGIKESTNDLDLLISHNLFSRIKNIYDLKPCFFKFPNLYELDSLTEVRVEDFDKNDVTYIDGYPIWSLEKQLEWKKNNHRKKDLADIKLIEEYLKNK